VKWYGNAVVVDGDDNKRLIAEHVSDGTPEGKIVGLHEPATEEQLKLLLERLRDLQLALDRLRSSRDNVALGKQLDDTELDLAEFAHNVLGDKQRSMLITHDQAAIALVTMRGYRTRLRELAEEVDIEAGTVTGANLTTTGE